MSLAADICSEDNSLSMSGGRAHTSEPAMSVLRGLSLVSAVAPKQLRWSRVGLRGVMTIGPTLATEKERVLGMLRARVVGEPGEGLLLRLATGLELGVLSHEWRKLELRVRHGSGSSVGIPVADVVVVHVLADMRRMRLWGRLRRRRCNT